MNLLPNHERAIIEDSKLMRYVLNPQNERGRHKTRVFESTLGFNLSNWTQLKKAILDALPHHEATSTSETDSIVCGGVVHHRAERTHGRRNDRLAI